VVGRGKAFYAEAVARGQEGVMAKYLASAYRPGRRSAAWRKIKPPPA
jgi:DNA ligase-1